MRAADVMTRAVATVHPAARIVDAIRLMLDQRISGLPVVDSGGELVGMLTEGDLLRRAETGTERRRPRWIEFLRGPGQQADDYVHAHGRRVEEVMTREMASVGEEFRLKRSSGSWKGDGYGGFRSSPASVSPESSVVRIYYGRSSRPSIRAHRRQPAMRPSGHE